MDVRIEDLETMESDVGQCVRDILGDLALLPSEVTVTYKELGRAFALVSDGFTDHQVTAFMFLLNSLIHQVLMGCLTIFRGHPTDSTMYTRKAIEITAFCVEILLDRDSAQRWMEIGKSKKAMEKYRSRFPAWKIVKDKLEGRDKELVDTYEVYCLMVHPGLGSVSRQAAVEGGDFPFDHFEVSSPDHHDALIAHYLLSLTMLVRMCDVLARVCEELKTPLASTYHEQFAKTKSMIEEANRQYVVSRQLPTP